MFPHSRFAASSIEFLETRIAPANIDLQLHLLSVKMPAVGVPGDTGTITTQILNLGPDDVPISDAFVEIPSLALATRSDVRGRFRFAAIPTSPVKQHLRVRAKAREFPFTVDSSKPSPFVLRLDLAKV